MDALAIVISVFNIKYFQAMNKSNVLALFFCVLFYSYIPFQSYIYDSVSNSSLYSDFYDEMASKASLTEEEMQEWRIREKEYVRNEMQGIELNISKYQTIVFLMYVFFAYFSLKYIYNKTFKPVVFILGFYYAFILLV